MQNQLTLDVREIAPRDRHPQIFRTFDALNPGDGFLLVNDHDPKPLFYQFQAERPGQAEWLPQEEGPERWVIQIQKVRNTEPEEVVTLDVRPDTRAGREPFGKIMAAVAELRSEQSLSLINDFEPTPLYAILEGRGLTHRSERLPDGAWRIVISLAR